MEINAKIIKIHAEGTNKRYMTIQLTEEYIKSIRIPDYLYQELKKRGVITSQKQRALMDKLKKAKTTEKEDLDF